MGTNDDQGSRSWRRGSTLALGLLIVLTACSIANGSAASARSASTPLQSSRPVPQLVAASSLLRNECSAAATRVGFAVPCPQLVPSLSGRAMSCPRPVGAATSPCVGAEGSARYSIFFLEFSGFDVPQGYSGVDGTSTGHVTLEAHRLVDDPLKPCIGGERIGGIRVGAWTTSEFICPNDSLQVERAAQHGEGAYVGHLALEWGAHGITYIASAHGRTTANLILLKRLVRSTVLISPGM